MAADATLERKGEEVNERVEDTVVTEDVVVTELVKMGRGCAFDIAGQIGRGTRPNDLLPALASLEKGGIIRRSEKDRNDPRNYNADQVVYEIAR
jgi:hypothetical protein